MSDKDTWKLDKDSPVFNFFIEFVAYIITAIVVLVVGFIAAILFKDFTHLGRAGAVVTLIAIAMAYKDFYLDLRNMSFEETIKFIGKEKLFEIWASGFVHKKKNELKSIKPGFSEKDALDILESLKNYKNGELAGLDKEGFIKAWLKDMFNIWSKNLRGLEFTMLKIGTVLWAFSDLINIPLGW
ncbi:hypothetical protein J8L98_00225 [Pseudoalteromonas sp. MMG013]|uniref:hypothetical protein n=1 Tax=Pseudoalteromonas sp. MMG013 TaxID=2822687 RepID=UPI001B37FEC2|nr:hypothetical protein [Pseudoalteromonas sp. MMG013]MBQ4860114.1 hypothetical protein [Pseudoalteromonas sp. MMG013]